MQCFLLFSNQENCARNLSYVKARMPIITKPYIRYNKATCINHPLKQCGHGEKNLNQYMRQISGRNLESARLWIVCLSVKTTAIEGKTFLVFVGHIVSERQLID